MNLKCILGKYNMLLKYKGEICGRKERTGNALLK